MAASRVKAIVTSIVLSGFMAAPAASAATKTAATCSHSDVQAAISSAADGDIVSVPAGNCTWSSYIGIGNKNIWVRGAGIGQTVITVNGEYAFYVEMTQVSKGAHHISDMTLRGDITKSVMMFTSNTLAAVPAGRWRVNNIYFDFPSGSRSGVFITGVNYGVIDHNTFNWSDGVAVRHAFYLNGECSPGGGSMLLGDFANQQPLDFGTDRFVFVEDNTFIPNGNRPLPAYDASSGGGRLVFRYNTLNGGFVYNHWTRGCEMGAQAGEIYNNKFIGNDGYGYAVGAGYPMRLEAGTWLIFNNYAANFHAEGVSQPYVFLDDRRATGPDGPLGQCDGTKSWDGNAGDPAAPGWPCLGQIGRAPGRSLAQIQGGSKPASAPVYLWNNGTTIGCASGGSCNSNWNVFAQPAAYIKSTPHPNGEVDYLNNTPKPGYSPYAYPHPLVSGSEPSGSSSSGPAAPQNVRVVSN